MLPVRARISWRTKLHHWRGLWRCFGLRGSPVLGFIKTLKLVVPANDEPSEVAQKLWPATGQEEPALRLAEPAAAGAGELDPVRAAGGAAGEYEFPESRALP